MIDSKQSRLAGGEGRDLYVQTIVQDTKRYPQNLREPTTLRLRRVRLPGFPKIAAISFSF